MKLEMYAVLASWITSALSCCVNSLCVCVCVHACLCTACVKERKRMHIFVAHFLSVSIIKSAMCMLHRNGLNVAFVFIVVHGQYLQFHNAFHSGNAPTIFLKTGMIQ